MVGLLASPSIETDGTAYWYDKKPVGLLASPSIETLSIAIAFLPDFLVGLLASPSIETESCAL